MKKKCSCYVDRYTCKFMSQLGFICPNCPLGHLLHPFHYIIFSEKREWFQDYLDNLRSSLANIPEKPRMEYYRGRKSNRNFNVSRKEAEENINVCLLNIRRDIVTFPIIKKEGYVDNEILSFIAMISYKGVGKIFSSPEHFKISQYENLLDIYNLPSYKHLSDEAVLSLYEKIAFNNDRVEAIVNALLCFFHLECSFEGLDLCLKNLEKEIPRCPISESDKNILWFLWNRVKKVLEDHLNIYELSTENKIKAKSQ